MRSPVILPGIAQKAIAGMCGTSVCESVKEFDEVDENDAGRRWGNAICEKLKTPYADLDDEELAWIIEGRARELLYQFYPGYQYRVAAHVLRHHWDVVEIRICADCYISN